MSAIEKRLEELGITLPPPATPVANYVTTVQTGNLIFTSGHGPGSGEGKIYKSQLGTDVAVEDAYQSARQVGINLISTLKHALGELGYTHVSDVRIGKVVHVEVATDDPAKARTLVQEMCEKLLANPVIEQYSIEIPAESDER